MQLLKTTMIISGVVAIVAALAMIASIYPIENQVFAQQQDQAISFTV